MRKDGHARFYPTVLPSDPRWRPNRLQNRREPFAFSHIYMLSYKGRNSKVYQWVFPIVLPAGVTKRLYSAEWLRLIFKDQIRVFSNRYTIFPEGHKKRSLSRLYHYGYSDWVCWRPCISQKHAIPFTLFPFLLYFYPGPSARNIWAMFVRRGEKIILFANFPFCTFADLRPVEISLTRST